MTGTCDGCGEERDSLQRLVDEGPGYYEEQWLCYECRHIGDREECEAEAAAAERALEICDPEWLAEQKGLPRRIEVSPLAVAQMESEMEAARRTR